MEQPNRNNIFRSLNLELSLLVFSVLISAFESKPFVVFNKLFVSDKKVPLLTFLFFRIFIAKNIGLGQLFFTILPFELIFLFLLLLELCFMCLYILVFWLKF